MNNIKLSEDTILAIIKMLRVCSNYIESAEDLGVNEEYPELKEIRKVINYYKIDSMVDYLLGKIDE